jgi:hypothetical protein
MATPATQATANPNPPPTDEAPRDQQAQKHQGQKPQAQDPPPPAKEKKPPKPRPAGIPIPFLKKSTARFKNISLALYPDDHQFLIDYIEHVTKMAPKISETQYSQAEIQAKIMRAALEPMRRDPTLQERKKEEKLAKKEKT